VTADQALAAAHHAADRLPVGALFLDCNSCAPQTKQASAALIEQAGGRYVDVAVMAPIYLLCHRAPMLVSGPHADAALELMRSLDMDVDDADGDVGRASAIKLVRSIMMKGLEALTVECLLAGRQLGVDDVVIASLEKTYPGFGWDRRSGYMLERVMVIAALGLEPRMAMAAADWQRAVGGLDITPDSMTGGETRHCLAREIRVRLDAARQHAAPKTGD
jgi:3-hydroxyisobutyrate dehydrogenase-like beta-hydroxyacid dehydrogenase